MSEPNIPLLCFAFFLLGYYAAARKTRDAVNLERYGRTGKGEPKEYIISELKKTVLPELTLARDENRESHLSEAETAIKDLIMTAERGENGYEWEQ